MISSGRLCRRYPTLLTQLGEELGRDTAVKALPVVKVLARAVGFASGVLLYSILACLEGREVRHAAALALVLKLFRFLKCGSDGQKLDNISRGECEILGMRGRGGGEGGRRRGKVKVFFRLKKAILAHH